MIITNTWWASIFSGPLEHGINEDKLHLLENEAFLFLHEKNVEQHDSSLTN